MKLTGVLSLAFWVVTIGLVVGVAPQSAAAQSTEATMDAACADSARAFTLRQAGMDGLAVADPAATEKMRQAALVFYKCSQHVQNRHTHDLFVAYYADTLDRVGYEAGDSRALELASTAAQRVASSPYADVRSLIAHLYVPTPMPTSAAPTATPALAHSEAYCQTVVPSILSALDSLNAAIRAAENAGDNDTNYLANTSARYGSAFKYVENDYTSAESSLESANASVGAANGALSDLNEQEGPSIQRNLQAISAGIYYTDEYSRLALNFERGINGSNRQVARAEMSRALSSGMNNTSTTNTNGTVDCATYSAYNTNCSVNATSTTRTNDSATVAQENAANMLAAAQAGRLSYSQEDGLLTQGLPYLSQLSNNATTAYDSWQQRCPGT